MIKFKNENIMKAIERDELDVVFHQCNCFGVMGSGIAKELSRRYPQILSVDRLSVPGDSNKLGRFTYTTITTPSNKVMLVFNLYGQYSWKYGNIFYHHNGNKLTKTIHERYDKNGNLLPMTQLDKLNEALISMKNSFSDEEWKHYTFGTVKIGCGRGGANFENDVYPMLDTLFDKSKLYVYDVSDKVYQGGTPHNEWHITL